MTSIIKLQAFSGAQDESPPCYMLQVDEFRFLLDCGWDENFDMTYMDNLKKHMHQIDAILLSYPDPYHLGALPYLVGKCNVQCPIYATIPVYKMGQMFMYDLYQSRHNTEEFDLFTLDDVDQAFDRIIQLKYSQTIQLRGKGHGLQITPIAAGHMLGGTLWKIVKDGEEDIVYALDYNHKKERHLNGCALDSIQRPSLLITDAFNADYVQARRRLRDEQLMNQILQTVRSDGNVLIAMDTAGRVLELAHLLDQMWRSQGSGLMAYSLAMLNNVSYNVVEFAKSQVEWMSDKIMRAFEDQRNNPFQFKQLQLCHSLGELNKIPDPKVVLASVPDMECGFSRDLFLQWCSNPKNAIVLTSRSGPGTLARQLIDNPQLKSVKLHVRRRIRLEGEDLADHMRREKEKEAEQAEQAKRNQEAMESSDESGEEGDADTASKAKHDLMVKSQKKTGTMFFKQAKKAYPMFPYTEERLRWDDYGEYIRPEDYVIIEKEPVDDGAVCKKEKTDAEEEKMDLTEVPTKCIESLQDIDVSAQVLFIDFEGRSDGESVKKILAQVKPRQLVLVHGNPKATKMLAEYARNTRGLVQGKVYTPKILEVVDATKESHIYQVRLKDSVVSALEFSKVRDTEISWIDAILDMNLSKTDTTAKHDSQDAAGLEDEEMDEDSEDLIPTLVPLGPLQVPGHQSVFINEPRLSDFKQHLLNEGIQAEFHGGVLVCNNTIAIRRNEAGRMQLQGCLCDDYYKIRDLLYGQYAIV